MESLDPGSLVMLAEGVPSYPPERSTRQVDLRPQNGERDAVRMDAVAIVYYNRLQVEHWE